MTTWNWSELKSLVLGKFTKAEDNHDSIGVMWPVVYPKDYPGPPVEPHCTIMYLGLVSEANFTKKELLDAMAEVGTNIMVRANVVGLDWFGPNADIPVLRLHHPLLWSYQDQVEETLRRHGIKSASSFTDYKPHCTVTDYAANVGVFPNKLFLTTPQVWWGGEHLQPEASFDDFG